MEFRFYEVGNGRTARVLRVMLEKTLERKQRAVVRLASVARAAELDSFLWHEPADSFLPHARFSDGLKVGSNVGSNVVGDSFMAEQPIILTTGDRVANAARVLFHWQEGGEMLVPFPSDDVAGFELCCFLFERGDAEAVALGDNLWRQAIANKVRGNNAEVNFWREAVDGNGRGWVRREAAGDAGDAMVRDEGMKQATVTTASTAVVEEAEAGEGVTLAETSSVHSRKQESLL